MATRYRYIGDGSFLPGIPARDLTDDDLAELTEEQRADVAANAAHGDLDDGRPHPGRVYEAAEAGGAGPATIPTPYDAPADDDDGAGAA